MVSEGILFGLLAATGYGIADIFAKMAVTTEKNYLPMHISNFTALLLITCYNIFFAGIPLEKIGLHFEFAIVSLFMTIGWVLFWTSLKSGKVSIQTPIGSAYGLVTLVLSLLILGEMPALIQIAGALIIFLGVFFLSLPSPNLKNITIDRNAILAILAALSWGIAYVLLGPLTKIFPANIAFQSWIFFSFCYTLIYTLVTRGRILPENKSNLLTPFLSGIFDGGGMISYYLGATVFFTSLLAPISSVYPVFTLILAYPLLGERLKRFQYLAIITVLIGILLISV